MTSSTHPPKYPAITPSVVPITSTSPLDRIVMSRAVRAPYNVRQKTLWPWKSRPNQAAGDRWRVPASSVHDQAGGA